MRFSLILFSLYTAISVYIHLHFPKFATFFVHHIHIDLMKITTTTIINAAAGVV
jgi:hypothetical protein